MKSRNPFDIKVVQLETVQPGDEAEGIPKDIAKPIADFKLKCSSISKANDELFKNAFLDPDGSTLHVLSLFSTLHAMSLFSTLHALSLFWTKFSGELELHHTKLIENLSHERAVREKDFRSIF